MNTWVALLGGIGASVALGPVLAQLAAKRTSAQPSDSYPEDEAAVIAHVLGEPTAWVRFSALNANDFTDATCRAVWEAIMQATSHIEVPQSDRAEDITEAQKRVPSDLAQRIRETSGNNTVDDILSRISKPLTDKAALKAGQRVLDASYDRHHYQGAVALAVDPESGKYSRPYQPPSRTRVVAVTVALVLVAIASSTLSSSFQLGAGAAVSAWLILWTLGAAGILWASVDIDTLYIDIRTFWPVTATLWLATAATLWLDSKPQAILAGVTTIVAVFVLFEGSNLLYRLIRKRHGMGAGDTKLAIATVAIPAALSGTWAFGYSIVLSALVLAIAGWIGGRMLGRGSKDTPFAFGPYLAMAWVAAGIASLLAGQLLGAGT